MATIKSYTDIEQAKVLATILPLESADMNYWCGTQIRIGGHRTMDKDLDVPCWSLASLLGVLPEIQGIKPIIALDDNYITYPHMNNLHVKADNIVDACVAMIEKLHELKML